MDALGRTEPRFFAVHKTVALRGVALREHAGFAWHIPRRIRTWRGARPGGRGRAPLVRIGRCLSPPVR